MKHNDYIKIDQCKKCGAHIYAPVVWHGRGKHGSSNPLPRIATCQHPQRVQKGVSR